MYYLQRGAFAKMRKETLAKILLSTTEYVTAFITQKSEAALFKNCKARTRTYKNCHIKFAIACADRT